MYIFLVVFYTFTAAQNESIVARCERCKTLCISEVRTVSTVYMIFFIERGSRFLPGKQNLNPFYTSSDVFDFNRAFALIFKVTLLQNVLHHFSKINIVPYVCKRSNGFSLYTNVFWN